MVLAGLHSMFWQGTPSTIQLLSQNARLKTTIEQLLLQNGRLKDTFTSTLGQNAFLIRLEKDLFQDAFITQADTHIIEIFPELGVLAFIDLEIHHAIDTGFEQHRWVINDSFDKETNEVFRKVIRKIKIQKSIEEAEWAFIEDATNEFD